jgi:uncharacterized phage protein gp47/JayE
MQMVYLGFNPLTAIGPQLDLLGILIGTPRKISSYSTALLTVTGSAGTVITSGVAQDVTGQYWSLPASVTIPGSGSIAVTATAQTIGNITANASTITTIATPTSGWTAVTNPSGAVAGQPVESDSQYRARLIISQSLPSETLLAGTAAAIAAVSGVTRSMVYENPTNVTDGNGNPPHSITCVVEGGSSAAIAQAIYNNRGIGCLTNGTTSVNVTDPNNGNLTMSISFDILGYLEIFVAISVHPLAGFTSATALAIQAGLVNYLNNLGIGEAVVYSELYGAALSARSNPDQPTFSITAITDGYAAASTTATLNSTTTVVVAVSTGIANGQAVTGPGIPAGTTVSNISGAPSIVLSASATITATLVPLTFFTLETPPTTIPVAFNKAAQSASINVQVTQV